MEWNTIERAIKTETDTRTEQKEWISSFAQHPHHVKVSPRGNTNTELQAYVWKSEYGSCDVTLNILVMTIAIYIYFSLLL